MAGLNVLVVDDEMAVRRTLAVALQSGGHQVVAVAGGADALKEVQNRAFDLALVDLNLGGASGLDLISRLREASPQTRVILITGQGTIETAVEAMRRGAYDYLLKPVALEEVVLTASRVAELRGLEYRVSTLEDALKKREPEADFESRSPAMQQAVGIARQVADSEATVLLRGESGTGKTLLASAIHSWSRRARGPFGTVSCPTLSGELLASELFGHVKGAFTGAVRDNPGRVHACDGGTLFLDEIGDLPVELQPKLLRFLQERAYERIGENETRRADVRLVAATNADLEAGVREGRFREDLYYRLNVVEITLPPLRERQGDIVPLAQRLALAFSEVNGRPGRQFSPAAVEALCSYAWPGNLRELRNVVERAVLLGCDEQIGPEHLPGKVSHASSAVGPMVGGRVSLDSLEEAHIRGVLTSVPSLEEAARVLGIDTVTLWRRRKKYGI